MLVHVKKGRVWLKDVKEYRGKFIEVFIKNKNTQTSFIAVIPKDGRFYIPIKIRKYLEIDNDINIRKIVILKNKARSINLIENNKFNIISIIPNKTLSNYKIVIKELKNKYLCWYCTQGRPKEILLNKYVSLSFIKLLGYYQAEGGKPKLRKRNGRNFDFTNKRFDLIKDFFELSSYILDKKEWKATICYNKDIDYKIITDLKIRLNNLVIDSSHIFIKSAERIKEYIIKIWISNSILAETIDNFNKKIKDLIFKTKNENLFKLYYQGYLAGDGNFFAYRDKNGSLHSRTYLLEEKEEYIKLHKKILDIHGFNGKIKKAKDKNLYKLILTNNWNMLIKLLEYDLFFNIPHHKEKLIWTIRNHNKFRSLKYFINLPNKFDFYALTTITNREGNYCYNWLRKRRKDNLIERVDKGIWKLTNDGIKIRNVLNKLNSSELNPYSFQSIP